ncbi:RNA polymerase sigma factor [Arcticibacter svalbardensis]|uniref:RNA polymerase sigma factor n=1 Tax=Arcticibacter svalbardensis TaxID=1288027 RepID=UPI001360B487|nr:sigma-70 family RNA polymerase sigma factor [Arcticibacter svalbardensis]
MSSQTNIVSDQDLVRKLKAADNDVLELIYQRYAQKLYHAAYNLLRNKEVCEDLIHDLFVDLWLKRETYNINVLKPYLYAAIKSRVLMHLRSSKSIIDISSMEFTDNGRTPEHLYALKEVSQISNHEISNLPHKCREIYKLSRLEQRSHKEIAILKGISTKTVESQITIALKRLRPALKDYMTLIL